MAGGGLMQLVAYGAQDVYLTGNPQITFFKVVYRRHTNFALECIELPIDASARPGSTFNVQVLRNGDLASNMYLRTLVPALTGANIADGGKIAWIRRLGHALLFTAEITVGGSSIDKHWGVWLDIWRELTLDDSQAAGYAKMIGDVPEMTELVTSDGSSTTTLVGQRDVYTRLIFWCNTNYGLALPLIALQYHDVRINFQLENLVKLIVWSGESAPVFSQFGYNDCGLMVDYVYLDNDERRRMAQVGHEYLITQLQYPGAQTMAPAQTVLNPYQWTLNFNHPCKELIWASRVGAYSGNDASNFTTSTGRFLCYSNTDDWSGAVQYAADNLLAQMVNLASVSGVTAFTTGTINTGNSSTFTQIFTYPTSQTLTVTVTINNTSGSTINADSYGMYLSAFVSAGSVVYNLCQGLAAGTITLNVGATATTCSAVCTSHSIALRDLSVPVNQYTDNRNTAWTGVTDVSVVQLNNYGLRLDGAGNMVYEAQLVLNGTNRFDYQTGIYFNAIQPLQHHTRSPCDGINVYSFGLHPEQHQPSGTCNMSRIDTCILKTTMTDPFRAGKAVPQLNYTLGTVFYVFTVNYNIIRVLSGMMGVAYSN